MKLYKKKIPCAKNRFFEFIIMYLVVSHVIYVYIHTLKINSEKYNMYVVGSYIKYVYDAIYLQILNYILRTYNIYTYTIKPYLHMH